MGVRGRRLVLNLLTEGLCVFVVGRRPVERIGHSILLRLAEVVDQKVAGNRGDPSDESAFRGVVARKCAVHLDEDLLSEVLGVIARARETIADVIDTPVVCADDFFPGGGIAGNTAAHKHRNDLDVFQPVLPGNAADWPEKLNLEIVQHGTVNTTRIKPKLPRTRQYADVQHKVRERKFMLREGIVAATPARLSSANGSRMFLMFLMRRGRRGLICLVY